MLKSIISYAILILTVLIAIATVSHAQQVWSYCPGNINATFTISSLTLTPTPPVIGKEAVVVLDGTLNDEVTAGKSVFSIAYYLDGTWRSLPTFTNDVCDLLDCPVAPGPFTFNTSINVPYLTPPGQYQGTLQLTDQSNRNISCLTFATTLGYSLE